MVLDEARKCINDSLFELKTDEEMKCCNQELLQNCMMLLSAIQEDETVKNTAIDHIHKVCMH